MRNVSRSIKELEADLGITIFERTPKGMELTPDGEEFIAFAKDIVSPTGTNTPFFIFSFVISYSNQDFKHLPTHLRALRSQKQTI